ncbi:helix-turn-helix domain-containing protein [Nocardia sp. CA-128927]|uniref:helix-turn-helix domain-containing protein n=1 Tax=Nocardia sp. CA-128927 TaxID=3239975 RepID=UPI003D9563B7
MSNTQHPAVYLSRAQFAERIGVDSATLSKYKIPAPDVLVGPVNDDGTVPRGTTRGWLPETIDAWHAARPGHGGRPPKKT